MYDVERYHPRVEAILAQHGIPEQERLYRINIDGRTGEKYVMPQTIKILEILGGCLDVSKLDT